MVDLAWLLALCGRVKAGLQASRFGISDIGVSRMISDIEEQLKGGVPDAMTFKEQGYDLDALSWYALSVPAGTPRPIINGLNKAINQVIDDPEFVAKARAIGMEPKGGTPEELDRYIQAESNRWVPVLRSLNLPEQ